MQIVFCKIARVIYNLWLLNIFIFACNPLITKAQIIPEAVFEKNSNLDILNHQKSYSAIEALFSEFKNDSLKMKALIKKAEQSKAKEVESYALNALGAIYRNLSYYDKALKLHQEAKIRAEESKNIELEVLSLNMIGVVYRRIDLIKPALDNHKKALDIANAAQPITQELKHSIAVSQNSMGNLYLTLKQYDLARAQFEKSLIIEKEANNRLGLAINYQNLGYTDEAKNNLELALKNYKRSLDYNNQIDSEIGRVICYNSIGQVYIKQKKYKDDAI